MPKVGLLFGVLLAFLLLGCGEDGKSTLSPSSTIAAQPRLNPRFDSARFLCNDAPRSAIDRTWQVAAPRVSPTTGERVEIGLRNKFGAAGETHDLTVRVIGPDGVSSAPLKVKVTADKWENAYYPDNFPPAPPTREGTHTVIWEAPEGFVACDGFQVAAAAAVRTAPVPTPRPAALAPPAAPQVVAAPGSFTNGTKLIGIDIQPGTYRTRTPSEGCYWARLSGLSGGLSGIIANDNTDGPAIVVIAPTDKGFQSSRCSTWTVDMSPITSSPTAPFKGDGTYIVSVDIAPGTWRSNSSDSCYWARLSGFAGVGVRQVLANNNGVGVVTILPTDKGFETSRCGTWTKIG
jgi:hypothetical protein